MNHPENPKESFDYYTILKRELNGVLMVEATDEKVRFTVVSGVGNRHYTDVIRKNTAV